MVNYIGSMGRYMMGAFKEVSEEVYEARLQICQGCEFFNANHCSLCGCKCAGSNGFVSKLRLPHEKCPDNPPKWLEDKGV